MSPILYVVIPCYNEEKVLEETTSRLTVKLDQLTADGIIAADSRILYVDDCSRDSTWTLIQSLHERHPRIAAIRLSHNRGQQIALVAGLLEARKHAEVVISMDADLQDDIGVLGDFITEYHKGAHVVYGVRSKREKDTVFKRSTAGGFYKISKKMGLEIVANHAEYRLMSRQVLDCLAEYPETNFFLRGVISSIGFKTAVVYYERQNRFAGETKYSPGKLMALAFEAITSFSVKPLRFITFTGLTIALLSLLAFLVVVVLCATRVLGEAWPIWLSSLWLLGGIQLSALGLVGEYIGKAYAETKRRPKYFIDESIG